MPPTVLAFPLRARHAGTDPVHAANVNTPDGHHTACQMWLDPQADHVWLPADAEITCIKCRGASDQAHDRTTEK